MPQPRMHGRRNGFESGTAEGVEHEPPLTANRDAKGIEGMGRGFTLQQGPRVSPRGKCLEIYVQIGAFWSVNH